MCPDGYRGAQCQEEILPCDPVAGPCDLDHSECVVDVNGTETCVCDPGYIGTKMSFCEFQISCKRQCYEQSNDSVISSNLTLILLLCNLLVSNCHVCHISFRN